MKRGGGATGWRRFPEDGADTWSGTDDPVRLRRGTTYAEYIQQNGLVEQ